MAKETFSKFESEAFKNDLREMVGLRLAAARNAGKFKLEQGAARLGYKNASGLQKVERNTNKEAITIFKLVRAAKAYGVTTDFLLGLCNDPDVDKEIAMTASIYRAVEHDVTLAIRNVTMASLQVYLKGVPPSLRLDGLLSTGRKLLDAFDRFMELNKKWYDNSAKAGNTLLAAMNSMRKMVSVTETEAQRIAHARQVHAEALALEKGKTYPIFEFDGIDDTD